LEKKNLNNDEKRCLKYDLSIFLFRPFRACPHNIHHLKIHFAKSLKGLNNIAQGQRSGNTKK